MQITTTSVNSIKLNPENPRIIRDEKFQKLVKSIKEFPQMLEIRPIVVDEDMIVLGGNMRFKACLEAGLKEVPIILVNTLSEEQKKEFIIKDNVSFGDWSWENLANEWEAEQLQDWGLDVPVFGAQPDESLSGDLDDIDLPDVDSNTTRGILIPVLQENYEETYKQFLLAMKNGVDVGMLFLNLLKDENNSIGGGEGVSEE